MAGNSNESGRSVTSRVLRIFDAFDVEHPRLTLSDIARRADLPLATAHRLVGELADWRGLERDDEGLYFIGLRLWEVGLLGPLTTRLREVALPFMQQLYEATRENVHLAIRDGSDVLYVEKLAGLKSVPVISRVGGRLPMHATGVGKALLAYQTPEFVQEYLLHRLTRITRYTIVESGRMRGELDKIRSNGYAVTREEMTLGSCSVSAPIFDEYGCATAAVALVVHTVRVEPKRLAPSVMDAANAVTAKLVESAGDPYPTLEHSLDPSPGSGELRRRRDTRHL